MWLGLLAVILTRPWARRVAAIALVAITVTLFVIHLRHTAERAGRAAERPENLERAHAIQRKMLDGAAWRPRSRDDPVDRLRGGGF